ncbi:sensor histidine kinase [Nonomuraea africana]|uniref:Anti-sigma regulatory factor (Ser/Thr protein kinase) n=1 Tax=Nonomuraea africana TaxID=46171 RepID=A0ABR9KMR0_9ACTN|nr:sensor histidine kinase [Nonomuraea africana]MBE1562903.1 anti-sigma regulatory factor (Ser/Thr protein kinase) [Nonomuraea africana]
MHPDRTFRHVAVPYDSDEGFLRMVLPRVRHALAEGRQVLVVTDAAKLALLDVEVDTRLSSRWYGHPHRTLAAYLDYMRGRRTLVVGEPPWESWDERESREWIRYESITNAALGGVDATLLCLYRTEFAARAYLTHPEVLSVRYVDPRSLVLDGDQAPLPEPNGTAMVTSFAAHTLNRLRRRVSDFAREAGMDRNLVASLVLSVSEIAANSVEHGAGHGTVAMWTEGDEVVCEVLDPGGAALDDPLPGYIPPEPESPRGYGLWISRQLCDHVLVRADGGGLRVRLHMKKA